MCSVSCLIGRSWIVFVVYGETISSVDETALLLVVSSGRDDM